MLMSCSSARIACVVCDHECCSERTCSACERFMHHFCSQNVCVSLDLFSDTRQQIHDFGDQSFCSEQCYEGMAGSLLPFSTGYGLIGDDAEMQRSHSLTVQGPPILTHDESFTAMVEIAADTTQTIPTLVKTQIAPKLRASKIKRKRSRLVKSSELVNELLRRVKHLPRGILDGPLHFPCSRALDNSSSLYVSWIDFPTWCCNQIQDCTCQKWR